MKFSKAFWLPVLLALVILIVLQSACKSSSKDQNITSSYNSYNNQWTPPDDETIPPGKEGEMIRYGEDLIKNTAVYLGPKGSIKHVSNGMNCQNCHLDGGKQIFGNCFSAVAANYPKYRERSGRVESIAFRVNDCLLRSMNGHTIDSESTEMKAMVSYLEWLGKDVPKGVKPVGAGVPVLPFLPRAADPEKGKNIFSQQCSRCHGTNGEGVMSSDSNFYTYPPLWGPNSYNTAAGMYRLSSLANFVKSNMPFVTNYLSPQLTDEEAWDVAAFVNSQPRPQKLFATDWPNITKKPIDFPFGPYADDLSEQQHKYGPFSK